MTDKEIFEKTRLARRLAEYLFTNGELPQELTDLEPELANVKQRIRELRSEL